MIFSPLSAAKRALFRIQDALILADHSAPQPDLLLLRYREDLYPDQPTPADTLLVIEVAETSLEHDQTVKAAAYARAGIPECWVIDANEPRLIRHRTASANGYETIDTLRAGQPLAPAAFPEFALDLAWLLA
jgi:Uma2 family endonuclease